MVQIIIEQYQWKNVSNYTIYVEKHLINIVYNNDKLEFFPCDNGVKQGENMFSYLSALFLNDLENFMENQNSTDLNTYRGHGYCFRCIYNFFLLYSMLMTLF